MQGMSTFSVAATVALGRSMDNVKRGAILPSNQNVTPTPPESWVFNRERLGPVTIVVSGYHGSAGQWQWQWQWNRGVYGTDGLNANVLKADILRRYVSCLDFKCSRSRTEQPPFFSVGSINQGLAQLEADGVIINRMLANNHNIERLRPSRLVVAIVF